MDIAALSTMSSQMNIASQASILVLKQAMDASSQQADGLMQLMNVAAANISPSHLGNTIDIAI